MLCIVHTPMFWHGLHLGWCTLWVWEASSQVKYIKLTSSPKSLKESLTTVTTLQKLDGHDIQWIQWHYGQAVCRNSPALVALWFEALRAAGRTSAGPPWLLQAPFAAEAALFLVLHIVPCASEAPRQMTRTPQTRRRRVTSNISFPTVLLASWMPNSQILVSQGHLF